MYGKEKIVELMASIASLSEADKQLVERSFSRSDYAARQNMHYQGDVSPAIFFITKGLVRYGHMDRNGNDISFDFRGENQFVTDYASFLHSEPSQFFIECLEPTAVLKLDRYGLERLYTEMPQGNLIGRKIAEGLYTESQKRLFSFYNYTAEERYQEFLKDYSELAERIPQSFIASYIGVKPESLSRIKRRQRST